MAQAGISYPRFRLRRGLLRFLTGRLIHLLTKFDVQGLENLPKNGPVILAANHFHWSDPAFLLYASPRQLEFIAGRRSPSAPVTVRLLPKLWGIMPAFRGGYSRSTLKSSLSVLEQGGPVALFPEGGAWAATLRKPRAGVGFLALEAGVPVIPVALNGVPKLFKSWRPHVRLIFGTPIGPFFLSEDEARRPQINAVSDAIMRAISALLPDEQRGIYSSQEALRLEGERESAFPFEKENMRGQ